jgi:hypothetical protein
VSESDRFHSVVAKLMYLAKHGRPDILTVCSFLASRVNEPGVCDRLKLDRVLQYLYGSVNDVMRLSANNLELIAYIDASYGVHANCKSHSGNVIKLGNSTVCVNSVKQKLVTKSSTEAELVALSDMVGHVLWCRNLLIEQGYSVSVSKVMQDNQSTIVLANNGRSNNSKNRHINIKFYFVKDRIDNSEIKLEYISTNDMIADIMTKPLQGKLFVDMKNKLLNLE